MIVGIDPGMKGGIVVKMPLFVMLPRKTIPDKKYIINLNNYRNWNFIVSNQVKKAYSEIAKGTLSDFVAQDGCKVGLVFTLFKGSKRRIDRANVLSIHEKFFCDAMTDAGCIPDDNDEFVAWTHYCSGELDRTDPRVEIQITREMTTVWRTCAHRQNH